MYVCMYVYIYIYIYTHSCMLCYVMCICVHMYIYTYIYIYIHKKKACGRMVLCLLWFICAYCCCWLNCLVFFWVCVKTKHAPRLREVLVCQKYVFRPGKTQLFKTCFPCRRNAHLYMSLFATCSNLCCDLLVIITSC